MKKAASTIRCKARLLRPATAKGVSWTFLVLPKNASARLPTRGMTTVKGTINAYPFRATLAPDGQRSHWLKVNKKMREGAGAVVRDHAHCTQGLDPLDYVREAGRDASAPDRKCL